MGSIDLCPKMEGGVWEKASLKTENNNNRNLDMLSFTINLWFNVKRNRGCYKN